MFDSGRDALAERHATLHAEQLRDARELGRALDVVDSREAVATIVNGGAAPSDLMTESERETIRARLALMNARADELRLVADLMDGEA